MRDQISTVTLHSKVRPTANRFAQEYTFPSIKRVITSMQQRVRNVWRGEKNVASRAQIVRVINAKSTSDYLTETVDC